ncbi:MAG: YgiT-type zinc finger protein [Schwartzia sp.]|nr:YgiT-type zinc finger protein [Schwartzia sp. (in: firmicutes)]
MKIKDICPVCGHQTVDSEHLTVYLDKGDYEIIIWGVLGRKCQNCSEQVFSRDTVKNPGHSQRTAYGFPA